MDDARLLGLLEPGAEALGFEILAVELSGRGKSRVVRVYIDGPDGVSIDDCADVSHQLSAILDVEDPIPEQFTLEVSSPGLDRPLTKPRHFAQVVGQRIKVRTRLPIEGRRRFTGGLLAVTDAEIEMEVDGERHRIGFAEIEKARLVPDI